MYPNRQNLRFQSDLRELGIYQRDMLAVLRVKTISEEARINLIADMMAAHQSIVHSLTRVHKEWAESDLYAS